MLLEHKVPQLMATISQPDTPVQLTKKTPVKTINGASRMTNGAGCMTNHTNVAGHMTNGVGHVTNGTRAAVHVLG